MHTILLASAKWSQTEHFEEFGQLICQGLFDSWEGAEMAWLRLTLQDGRTDMVNTDEVSEIYNDAPGRNTDVRTHDGVTSVRETVDEIAAMIEAAEWRERVLKCACAIMSNEHSNGLTSEQVWARAARFAAMEPERPECVL